MYPENENAEELNHLRSPILELGDRHYGLVTYSADDALQVHRSD